MSRDVERRRRFEEIAEEVYEPLQRFLRRRASTDDADDVLGDVLLTVWRRLDDVPADGALPWSYAVARRALANKRRSARRHLRLLDRLAAHRSVPLTLDPAEAEEHPELTAAMESLPAADREILFLWAWEELEPREIAVVLDTTANAVSLRLSRARKKLAGAMERQVAAAAGQEGSGHTEEGHT